MTNIPTTEYLDEKLERKEKLRREALFSRDPLSYYKLSTALGLNPENLEDKDLYEIGQAEIEAKKMKLESRVKESHKLLEKEFLTRAKELNIDDFCVHADAKRGFLEAYFPGRFGPRGKQRLSRYDDVQVGALFKSVYDSYLKKYSCQE